jgi:hypothetical protein
MRRGTAAGNTLPKQNAAANCALEEGDLKNGRPPTVQRDAGKVRALHKAEQKRDRQASEQQPDLSQALSGDLA